ncbi:MAG: hypothetical protein AAGI46_12995 [Planctomycetota bacterium]
MTISARQTAALSVDALRRLRSAKLFWISLALSTLVALLCGYIGISEEGLSFPGFGTWENPVWNSTVLPPEEFYILVFTQFGISIWLAYAANLLAVISTASLVPALVDEGSVDLYLSRPMGRVRLFLTRYATGLLFVALQAACFSIAAMAVFGFRAGVFLPGLLWAVVYVTVFFSFLFCVSSLVGLLTGSGVTAILVTILFWMFIWAADWAEFSTLIFLEQAESEVERREREVSAAESIARRFEENGSAVARETAAGNLENARDNLEAAEAAVPTIKRVHDVMIAIKLPMPKTGETIGELQKVLSNATELERFEEQQEADADRRLRERVGRRNFEDEEDANRFLEAQRAQQRGATDAVDRYYSRSFAWTFGTSFCFQGVLLAIACWVFGRRDL